MPFESTVLGSPEESWGFEMPVEYSWNSDPRLSYYYDEYSCEEVKLGIGRICSVFTKKESMSKRSERYS